MKSLYGIDDIHRFSRQCFYVASGIGLGFGVILIIVKLFHIDCYHLLPPCFFYRATHYYCFGCGGTRAVRELAQGNILKSIYYHPIVVYGLIIYTAYIISHIISILFHKGKGMLFRPGYFYLAMVITVLQCLVKNYLVYRYQFVL